MSRTEVHHVTAKQVKRARKKALAELGWTLDEYRAFVDDLCCESCGPHYADWTSKQQAAYRAIGTHEFLLGQDRASRRKAREGSKP